MEKRPGDIRFRPATPKLDPPASRPTQTIRLLGSLAAPGGRSLVSPPTIEMSELYDGEKPLAGSASQPISQKLSGPFFPGDPVYLEAISKTRTISTENEEHLPECSTDKLARINHRLRNRLSFERIDELTRPPGSETEKEAVPPSGAVPRRSGERTFDLTLPDWNPLPAVELSAREREMEKPEDAIPENPAQRSSMRKRKISRKKEACFRRHYSRRQHVFRKTESRKDGPLENEPIRPEGAPLFPMIPHSINQPENRTTTFMSEPMNRSQSILPNETPNLDKPVSITLPMARSGLTELLKTDELTKSYTTGKIKIPVLNGVDFTAYGGEFVSIIGQSGSGKSTLLHLLGTLDNPDSGTIHFDGRRIDNLPIRHRDVLRNRSIGFIFQFYHLLPELTTLENVLSPLMIRESVWGYLSRRRSHIDRGKELLDKVGLSHRLKHKPSELSGGEMQRAAIARSLITEPKILLADEPTGNLDSNSAGEIIEILRRLNEERSLTIVMVTHDNIIAKAADRMVRMVDGRIAEENPTTLEDRLLHRVSS